MTAGADDTLLQVVAHVVACVAKLSAVKPSTASTMEHLGPVEMAICDLVQVKLPGSSSTDGEEKPGRK